MFNKKINTQVWGAISRGYFLNQVRTLQPRRFETRIKELSENQLRDKNIVRRTIEKGLEHYPKATVSNLFGGKFPRGGYTKESEYHNQHRRRFNLNVQKKEFYSPLLDKTFKLRILPSVLKDMRKVGGFDNYILLTHSDKLKSQFGELLRRIMTNKLMDEDYNVPDMPYETRFIKTKTPRFERRKKILWGDKGSVWVPPELRYTDLKKYEVNHFDEKFTKYKDRDFLYKLEKLKKTNEFIYDADPRMKAFMDEVTRQTKLLQPKIEKVKEEYKTWNFLTKQEKRDFEKMNKESIEFFDDVERGV